MKIKRTYFLFLIIILGALMVSCSNVSNESDNYYTIALENTDDTYEFLSWTNDRIPMVSAQRGGRYYIG